MSCTLALLGYQQSMPLSSGTMDRRLPQGGYVRDSCTSSLLDRHLLCVPGAIVEALFSKEQRQRFQLLRKLHPVEYCAGVFCHHYQYDDPPRWWGLTCTLNNLSPPKTSEGPASTANIGRMLDLGAYQTSGPTWRAQYSAIGPNMMTSHTCPRSFNNAFFWVLSKQMLALGARKTSLIIASERSGMHLSE